MSVDTTRRGAQLLSNPAQARVKPGCKMERRTADQCGASPCHALWESAKPCRGSIPGGNSAHVGVKPEVRRRRRFALQRMTMLRYAASSLARGGLRPSVTPPSAGVKSRVRKEETLCCVSLANVAPRAVGQEGGLRPSVTPPMPVSSREVEGGDARPSTVTCGIVRRPNARRRAGYHVR